MTKEELVKKWIEVRDKIPAEEDLKNLNFLMIFYL